MSALPLHVVEDSFLLALLVATMDGNASVLKAVHRWRMTHPETVAWLRTEATARAAELRP
jgi:hypothetical protein